MANRLWKGGRLGRKENYFAVSSNVDFSLVVVAIVIISLILVGRLSTFSKLLLSPSHSSQSVDDLTFYELYFNLLQLLRESFRLAAALAQVAHLETISRLPSAHHRLPAPVVKWLDEPREDLSGTTKVEDAPPLITTAATLTFIPTNAPTPLMGSTRPTTTSKDTTI
ncbi:hypothetical protein M378DRAFT_11584 [Amanita muscaria Koide BX008]|uniref:Uncharacterized protein n=1 Tax=Amanita muscaria (strain Koide BX008) TaxID=946122 RepID=A0A0C2TC41_AMAMK|nr:hypothetical protein M378DRAFT_11584 [Amanita muscaria Koide BX008]